jgi:hypothetical protein
MSVKIKRWTGSTPDKTDITSINTRANATDSHSTGGTTHSILIPDSGTNYSYWVTTGLYYDGSGTGTINNLEWFASADPFDADTGVTGVVNKVDSIEYDQATGTEGETGDLLTDHTNITTALAMGDQTTASPLALDGSVTDPSDEDFGDLVVYQLEVGPTASAGATSQVTCTFRYDTTIS